MEVVFLGVDINCLVHSMALSYPVTGVFKQQVPKGLYVPDPCIDNYNWPVPQHKRERKEGSSSTWAATTGAQWAVETLEDGRGNPAQSSSISSISACPFTEGLREMK